MEPLHRRLTVAGLEVAVRRTVSNAALLWCLLGQGQTQRPLLFGVLASLVAWPIVSANGPIWLLLLPLLAALLAMRAIPRGLRALRTFAEGSVTVARLVGLDHSRTLFGSGRGGGHSRVSYRYEYETPDGSRYQLVHEQVGRDLAEVGDEAEVAYLSANPEIAFLTSTFGQGMQVDASTVTTPRKAFVVLLLPSLFLGVNLLGALRL